MLTFVSATIFGQSYSDIANLKTGDYDASAAPVVGLWEVLEVIVGDEKLTPTAKWFHLLSDGSMTSGNGWVQNFDGSFNYDRDTKKLLQASQGTVDEFGAFDVTITKDGMVWKRLEMETPVKVTLKKVDKKPLAPWDIIIGNWEVEEQTINSNKDDHAPEDNFVNFSAIYFGWDRRFKKYDETGKRIETGIWHIEAHSNWIWLISDKDNTKTGFDLDLSTKSLKLEHKTELQTLKIKLLRDK
ncbi:hypothetical protein BFP71_01730 [Roseivirga misakiensis]|uniref:Lipocalin-like domain-containing protein n=2 Tax=Roseivirga misakiensis TaxID=1563681 RepID=A0A1E5T4X0_9BACT|nr:hypothetical protein BFP71_01730 [Roseivirga misakiensis]